jgi:PKD repeat protein
MPRLNAVLWQPTRNTLGGTRVRNPLKIGGVLTVAAVVASCADPASTALAPAEVAPKARFEITTTSGSGGPTVIGSDTFTRLLAGSWGTADVGGVWDVSSADPNIFKVDGSRGLIVAPSSSPRTAILEGVDGTDVTGLVSFTVDRAPDNPSRFHTIELYARRSANGDNFYRYRVRAFGTGAMDIRAEKRINGVSAWVTPNQGIPTQWQSGAKYWVRWECGGSSPATAIRMKVWRDGDAEPVVWQIETTVDEPGLDVGQTTGIRAAGPSSDQVNYPITFAFDDLEYLRRDPNNLPPIAEAGGPYTGTPFSTIQFDGSASFDPNGDTELAYAWNFGDGTAGTGATPTHSYASAGTYVVTLTMTDSWGRSGLPDSAAVTINPEFPNQMVVDRFSRVQTGGWGRPEVGGSWYMGGASHNAFFQVNGSEGLIVVPDTKPRVAIATEGYGLNVVGLVSFSIDTRPDEPSRFHTIHTYARRDDHSALGEYYYRYRVRAYGDGKIDLRIDYCKAEGHCAFGTATEGTDTWVTPAVRIPVVWEPGTKYWIRWGAVGTNPSTVVSLKVWKDGTPEPASPQASATVAEPTLDIIGTAGIRIQAPSGQTTFPITFTFDDLEYVTN